MKRTLTALAVVLSLSACESRPCDAACHQRRLNAYYASENVRLNMEQQRLQQQMRQMEHQRQMDQLNRRMYEMNRGNPNWMFVQ